MKTLSKLILGATLTVPGLALAAEFPAISPGAEYGRAAADLRKSGFRPVRQTGERASCASQKSLCDAFPEMRECAGEGEAIVCLFQWASSNGRTAAFVEARGGAPKALRVTRAYVVLTGGNPYPLGTSGL